MCILINMCMVGVKKMEQHTALYTDPSAQSLPPASLTIHNCVLIQLSIELKSNISKALCNRMGNAEVARPR